MNIKTASYDSVIIYFKQVISEEILDEVQHTYKLLKELDHIIDITPSYCSILVIYDIFKYDQQTIKEAIIKKCSQPVGLASADENPSKLIKIPTDYKNNLDLKRVAQHNNLSIKEVITLHTNTTYRVYAIGFMVGFAYLATVDKKIATPRLESPRKKVPKGSVAIADNQTAIYPQESAGGWNVIAHTKFDGFEDFCVGDRIKFMSIE
ncbi:MAG: allophanate hydrolase subunit 1 [Sulfurovaceae bacterium]|nr:allophanate hydrolase subunit 1 [Sulfurovaceae bacterium]